MFGVSVEGVGDAVDSLNEAITPALRREAQLKARLENAQREAEIQQINAKILTEKAHAEREQASVAKDKAEAELLRSQANKTEAEAGLIWAEAMKMKTEALKTLQQMRLGRIELGLKLLEKVGSTLTEQQKIDLVMRLLPDLNTAMDTDLKLITAVRTQDE